MFEIPADRLPPGFVETVDDPPEAPATPRPAATVVLLRDRSDGPQALLMRRHRRSGFVPGAWVFPGGRVDQSDEAAGRSGRVTGLPDGVVPPPAFWTAAVRELFEETGVLLARDSAGAWSPDASSSDRVEELRSALMDGEATLLDVLEALDLTVALGPLAHIAHWVTPVVERRRYDTHFFVAALPAGRSARADPREMTEARWLSPDDALARFERGELPMVFPTVKTLEGLRDHGSTDEVLEAFRSRRVRRILPRLVRTEHGVAIVVDDD